MTRKRRLILLGYTIGESPNVLGWILHRATITDDTMVARRYFQEAVNLDPSDARYLGFLARHTLTEGALHRDERLIREGYVMMLDAIKAWPEFNLFTGGYVMSRLPADSRLEFYLQVQHFTP